MLINYLVVAIRNLFKRSTLSFINIGGLAISLASCVFIFFYVYDELTYDRFHEKSDRIYRVTQVFITPESSQNLRFTHQKLGPYLKRNYHEVEEIVRFEVSDVKLGKEQIKERGVAYTDPGVFNVFTYPLIEGDSQTALQHPASIVLSEAVGKKYNVELNDLIEVDGKPFLITGIMKNVPANSDKWISALARGEFGGEESADLEYGYDTYIMLRSKDDITFIKNKLESSVEKLNNNANKDLSYKYDIQSLEELHFYQGVGMDNPKGNEANVYIMLSVASALFLVVIFNFINLTTARSLDRMKEVGIRKATGATRGQLVIQFVTESIFVVLLSAVLALIVMKVSTPLFVAIAEKEISFDLTGNIMIIIMIVIFLIVLVVAASFYPAWVLSTYKPTRALKGKPDRTNVFSLSKIFLVAQYAMSSALVLFLIVILMQMESLRSTNLGFNGDQIMVIRTPEDSLIQTNGAYYKNELLSHKSISQVSTGGFASNLGTADPFDSPVWLNDGETKRELILPNIVVDHNYPHLLQLDLKAGEWFSESDGAGKAIVNEAFTKISGWKNPIGKNVSSYAGEATIVGVVNDFHFKSLHNVIEPLIIFSQPSQQPDVRFYFLKINTSATREVSTFANELFKTKNLDYFFLNDFFNEQYNADEKLHDLFLYFSVLTLIIAALGLFGLTSQQVETRVREIGIRKVFGASSFSIIGLFTGTFSKPVIAGTVIGCCVSWYFSHQWLATFAYSIKLTAWMVAVTAMCVFALAAFIVFLKTYRVAHTNPIESLRHE
jgi:putative ABC transport system permease protein